MKKHHVISGIYHSTEAPETRGWGVGGRTATNRDQEPDATCVVWSMSSCRSMSAQGSEPHRQAKGRTYWKEKGQGYSMFLQTVLVSTGGFREPRGAPHCSPFPTVAAGSHADGCKLSTRLSSSVGLQSDA